MYRFVFKGLVIIVFYLICLYQYAIAIEIECEKCHQKVYDEIAGYKFQHSTFILKECDICHISKKAGTADEPKGRRIPVTDYTIEHMVVLSNMSIDRPYQMKISLNNRKGKKRESNWQLFTPSEITEYFTNDETPPSISRVIVERVELAAFVSAEVSWETDELSDSVVEYGLTTDYGYSAYSINYNKRHIVKLNGLEHKKVYHYRVISRDVFGNKAASGDYVLDVSKDFNIKQKLAQSEDDILPEFRTIKVLGIKQKDKNSKSDKVVVYFTVSDEVTSVVEYLEKKDGAAVEEKHGSGGLKSKRETGIDACVKACHRQGASHPVGVTSRGRNRIPDNLPTAEGRIMTCATCHTPHGSNIKYLARLDFSRDICVLCHTDR